MCCCSKWITCELTLVFLFEQGIDIALSKLKQGDWVHIFPEGSRSRDGGKSIGTVRRGIGRSVIHLHFIWLQTMFAFSTEILVCCP